MLSESFENLYGGRIGSAARRAAWEIWLAIDDFARLLGFFVMLSGALIFIAVMLSSEPDGELPIPPPQPNEEAVGVPPS